MDTCLGISGHWADKCTCTMHLSILACKSGMHLQALAKNCVCYMCVICKIDSARALTKQNQQRVSVF
jgi:hypothetical protein